MSRQDDRGWKTRRVRGEGFHPLVDYIVLAEFDIDTGSTVRHQYPCNIPGYKVDWFAEFMLPEGAHNRDLDYNYIFLNRDSPHVDQDLWCTATKYCPRDIYSEDSDNPQKKLLYGINVVKTRYDSSVRRGAIVKAMCVFSQYQFVDVLKKPLELALDRYFDQPGVDVLKHLYTALNAVDLSHVPRPDLLEQTLMRRGVAFETIAAANGRPGPHVPAGWYHTVQYNYEGASVPLHLPLFRTPDEVGEANITLLVKTFGEQTMRIFHAILTKQRVLFVGYNHAASEVAQMVLSAVAMVSPPLVNVIRRTFPYSNLSDLSFLEVPGYVAGVTNPMFQQHDSWWDLLCILDLPNGTGQIHSAEERRKDGDSGKSSAGRMTPPPAATASPGGAGGAGGKSGKTPAPVAFDEQPHYSGDQKFMKGVTSGVAVLLGEDWVRQQFQDLCGTIVGLALDQDQNVVQNTSRMSPKVRKFIEANAQRIAAVRKAPEFSEMAPHPWVWCSDSDIREIEQSLLNPSAQNSPAGVLSPAASLDPPPSPEPTAPPSPVGVTPKTGRPPRGKSDKDAPIASTERGGDASPLPRAHLSFASTPVSSRGGSTHGGEALPPAPLSAARGASDAVTVTNPARAYRSVWLNLRAFVRKLQLQLNLNSIDETQMYYQHFDLYLRTEAALQALLALMPESKGGLMPIAVGLFHRSPMVRMSAMHVLQRVQQYPSTSGAYVALEGCVHCAFERQQEKEADGSLQEEIADFNRASKEVRRGIVEGDEIGSPLGTDTTSVDGGDLLVDAAAGALNSLVQGTMALMGAAGVGDGDGDGDGSGSAYNSGFSETIDELDLLR